MGVYFRPTCIKTLNREQALQSAAALMFRKAAEHGEFDDTTILAHTALFDFWQ